MNRKIIVLTILLMAFVGFTMAGSVSAVKTKVIDKGSVKATTSAGDAKFSWVTYQSGSSYIKVKGNVYVIATKTSVSVNFILQKVKGNKFTIISYVNGKKVSSGSEYTKLTVTKIYWSYFRHLMATKFLQSM